MRALQALHQSGVVSFKDLDPSNIPSQMMLVGTVNRIRDPDGGHRQQWLIAPGMWDDAPRVLTSGDDEQNELQAEGDKAQTPTPITPVDPKQERLTKDLKVLRRRIQVSRKVLTKAQAEGGWTDKHLRNLYLMVLWMFHEGNIRDPAAFAASELANKEPMAYESEALQQTHDLKSIGEWARSTDGPLYDKSTGTPVDGKGG
jgi:hypothetical protein